MNRTAEPRLVGEAPALAAARAQIVALAPLRTPVLVLGETGAGKGLAARALHAASGLAAPLTTLAWSGVPWDQLEREVFGELRADGTLRVGMLGGRGTLLLDEIGEMPTELQLRLVRALEAETYRPVGGLEDLPLRARLVSTSSRAALEAPGSIRPDLLYRLAGCTVALPPLRERVGDIQALAAQFLADYAEQRGLVVRAIAPAALHALEGHPWPGNVRELKAVVEQLAMSPAASPIDGPAVERTLANLPGPWVQSTPPRRSRSWRPEGRSSGVVRRAPGEFRLREVERDMILQAYRAEAGNLSRAAARLGIPRTTLRDKVKRLGIEVPPEAGEKH